MGFAIILRSWSLRFAILYITLLSSLQAHAAPVITSLEPSSGYVGTEVTILGSGFGASQGSSTVTFSGVIGIPRSWSDSEIVVPVPEAATSGPVVVTVNGVHSKGVKFIVLVAINNVTPAIACPGTVVAINGSGFGPTQGTSTVTFNGILAIPTGWSPTTIDVPVPAGATSGPLVVTVKGQSASIPFTVTPCP